MGTPVEKIDIHLSENLHARHQSFLKTCGQFTNSVHMMIQLEKQRDRQIVEKMPKNDILFDSKYFLFILFNNYTVGFIRSNIIAPQNIIYTMQYNALDRCVRQSNG